MAKSAWMTFLAAYRKKNPGKTLKECMKGASAQYKKKSSK